jgi:hypothetical protein
MVSFAGEAGQLLWRRWAGGWQFAIVRKRGPVGVGLAYQVLGMSLDVRALRPSPFGHRLHDTGCGSPRPRPRAFAATRQHPGHRCLDQPAQTGTPAQENTRSFDTKLMSPGVSNSLTHAGDGQWVGWEGEMAANPSQSVMRMWRAGSHERLTPKTQ